MPAFLCPRCQRANPDQAQFCHYDGTELRAGSLVSGRGRLHQDFVFPSGRRCGTFDELAQACQEDWVGARELLRKGAFVHYFSTVGRMDLARAAQDSMGNTNPDIGLSNLISSMPLSQAQGPKLDLHPRRLLLGTMLTGETRQVPLLLSNEGRGLLQGTLSVTEGGEWLRINGSANGQCTVETPREQQVILQVDTRGLAAGQTYGARLTVITNGGVVELAARVDLAAHTFARAPFQGARTPREMAERMRAQPKAAVPLLESGEICRWFESNGWNYPVHGASAKGVAGVQQFFESMGLSKPPAVQISQTEAFYECTKSEIIRGQVIMFTPAKKWVYATVEGDAPWIKVLTPSVSGPQQAPIGYEIDASQAPAGVAAEGHLNIHANGGQKLVLRLIAQVEAPHISWGKVLLQPMLACVFAFFALRLLAVPIIDVYGRGAAADAALARITPELATEDRPNLKWGGWLKLPWPRIFWDAKPETLDGLLGEASAAQRDRAKHFRDYYTGYLLRLVVEWTWWLVAIAGVFVMWRRGNFLDAPWGLVAGGAAGVAFGATLGSLVLLGDLVPHFLWELTMAGKQGGPLLLVLWAVLTLVWWTTVGFGVGVALTIAGPLGRLVLFPLYVVMAGCFRLVGLRQVGDFFAPP